MGNKSQSESNYYKSLFEKNLKFTKDFEKDSTFPDYTPCFIPKHLSLSQENLVSNSNSNIFKNVSKEQIEILNYGKESVLKQQDRREVVENVNEFPFTTIGVVKFYLEKFFQF